MDQLARQVREGMQAIREAQKRADARAEREHDERVTETRLLREELGRVREDLSAQRDVLDDCPRH